MYNITHDIMFVFISQNVFRMSDHGRSSNTVCQMMGIQVIHNSMCKLVMSLAIIRHNIRTQYAI